MIAVIQPVKLFKVGFVNVGVRLHIAGFFGTIIAPLHLYVGKNTVRTTTELKTTVQQKARRKPPFLNPTADDLGVIGNGDIYLIRT